jgi:alkanesulfonate monooxygenase SsuD/methylene tetrahydromethanopterin reductase-like flavin-dependent oxidoreductase (luciferase family)
VDGRAQHHRERIAPSITLAAADARKPAPRILAGINICVTDNPQGARARAAQQLALYGTLPAYRAMLDAEGVEAPEDLLIAGDEETFARGITQYTDAGATDARVSVIADDEQDVTRSWSLLRALAEE